jgi:hypothetical protein
MTLLIPGEYTGMSSWIPLYQAHIFDAYLSACLVSVLNWETWEMDGY